MTPRKPSPPPPPPPPRMVGDNGFGNGRLRYGPPGCSIDTVLIVAMLLLIVTGAVATVVDARQRRVNVNPCEEGAR